MEMLRPDRCPHRLRLHHSDDAFDLHGFGQLTALPLLMPASKPCQASSRIPAHASRSGPRLPRRRALGAVLSRAEHKRQLLLAMGQSFSRAAATAVSKDALPAQGKRFARANAIQLVTEQTVATRLFLWEAPPFAAG